MKTALNTQAAILDQTIFDFDNIDLVGIKKAAYSAFKGIMDTEGLVVFQHMSMLVKNSRDIPIEPQLQQE